MTVPKRPKALVLDDEPLFETLLSVMLVLVGWECEVATCREKAVACLKAEHFDVLITDYPMPQGNGFHFICCLRQEGIILPAIVMSGDARALRFTQKDLLNIPAVLLKPFTVSDLRAALAKAS
jgi:CheY-like chemotaxis protein